ncbi:hypothetical protein SEVIR_2G379750v4 [Setaria viridis]
MVLTGRTPRTDCLVGDLGQRSTVEAAPQIKRNRSRRRNVPGLGRHVCSVGAPVRCRLEGQSPRSASAAGPLYSTCDASARSALGAAPAVHGRLLDKSWGASPVASADRRQRSPVVGRAAGGPSTPRKYCLDKAIRPGTGSARREVRSGAHLGT